MKWVISIWLITAGMGVSYHIVAERKKEIKFFIEMEESLARLAYYMYQWRMPVKEILFHMEQEEKGTLKSFYRNLEKAMEGRQAEDFGELWKEQSNSLWQDRYGVKDRFERETESEIHDVWSEAFRHMPMESEELNRGLHLRMNQIRVHREAVEEKYKGEQKLVFTMGFFVSAFFCLIFL